MMSFALGAGGLVAAVVASEVALGPRKIQTGLLRVIAVYGAIGGGLLLYFALVRRAEATSFALFWAGAFLSWFGVRSHIESSILLRMVYLLRRGPLAAARLLHEYEARYGAEQRLEELVRAGLAAKEAKGGLRVTAKGRRIATVARWLG